VEAWIAKEGDEEKRLKYFQGFFFYPPLLAGLIFYASAGRANWWIEFSLSFVGGLVAWMFIEYVMHRALFHRPEKRGHWWSFMPWAHHTHHDYPRDIRLILAPVWFSFPISILVLLLLRLLLGNWQIAVFVLSGIWSGYLWYEFVHYSAHCRQPRTRLMRFLKTYHLLHHHTSESIWFGVTSPFIDQIFGTYRGTPRPAKEKK
jgi:sterol desaturase/sphingolipid hydroxylase (fatty acid hydroxylase superfamily)